MSHIWRLKKMEAVGMNVVVSKEKDKGEVGAPTPMSGGVNGFGAGGNARSFSPAFHVTPMAEPMARTVAKR